MLIQPIEPVGVTIRIGDSIYEGHMVSLSETELEVSLSDYLEKDSDLIFIAQYFKGEAIIRDIHFAHYCFTYRVEIRSIQFQPGLLINTRL